MNLDELRRWPDFEAPELRAWDAADVLMLAEAAAALPQAEVVVIGDTHGALTLGALDAGAARVRVHQDALTGEMALRANGAGAYQNFALELRLVSDATLVLVRLPRSLDALEDVASLIAAHASPDVVVIAGGRIKHMSLSMNQVLARHFERVDVSRARQKSRLLIARRPLATAPRQPRRQFHDDLGLWVVATGGVFAGTSVDIGTRALLDVLGGVPTFERAIDLGSGTGILAATLKRLRPDAAVLATDQSAAAVASAILTREANDLDIDVTRDDALSQQPDASADLIVLNPPFHTGAAVDSRIASKLFHAASRVLRPGGELWTVWNSHLGYRPVLDRLVGDTTEVARTPKFTVTRSLARQEN